MTSRRTTRRSAASVSTVIDLEDFSVTEETNENLENSASLFLECEDEPLTPIQKTFHSTKLKEFTEQMKKLESLAKDGAKITAKSDGSVLMTSTTEQTSTPNAPGLINKPGPGTRLLMDPRTGRILGTINGSGMGTIPNINQSTIIRPQGLTPSLPQVLPLSSQSRMTLPPTVVRTQSLRPSLPTQPIPIRTPSSPVVRPAQVVDLTRSSPASSSQVNAQTKSKYPALLVHPKPQDAQMNFRRPELDQKVKSLLVLTPAKLTEWLIKEGLVPQEQSEQGVKLKLGMYQDAKKFPNSGGYVWLTEDARNKYVSVFKGSLFETIIQAPNVMLKLIYHWVCQTSLNNVLTWVKVDHTTVDTFFRHMRCICIASVQEEVVNLGGDNRAIELGVISLGTTTTDGNKREVKVEVLGVLERGTNKIRLRATEPNAASTQGDRFARIFKPLPTWVRRDSRIVADYSVDRDRLLSMGYTNVHQCSSGASIKKGENTNATIMEYLKRVVPRMFQNSLSVLPTSVIQQFLDELTFREVFAKGPLQCFDNIISKISNQTSFVTKRNATMSTRLRCIADNPFGDWRMTFQQQPPAGSAPLGSGIELLPPSVTGVSQTYQGIKRSSNDDYINSLNAKKMKVVMPTYNAGPSIDLESYYYGVIEGDIGVLMTEFKADMAFKCHLCKKVFMNNIEFMKHLSLHVENERATAVDLVDLCQCKYCLKDFDSAYMLNKHTDDEHLKSSQAHNCRICTLSFGNSTAFVVHMNRTHVRSELPYSCQVCGFRTSSHCEAVDHFTEAHDRTDKLQCPRCLKTYTLTNSKGYDSSVAAAFVEHLQSHQDGKRKKCPKCVLSFKDDNKGSLKQHLDNDHGSFKGFDGLEVYQYLANETPTKMSKPNESFLKLAPKKEVKKLGQVQQTAFAAQNLEDLAMYDVDGTDTCKECTRKMTLSGHFNAYLCCTKCRYSSCCSKALSIHVSLFHGPRAPTFNLGVPSLLDKEVFCVCGFSAKSGNKIAKHLALHGCRSAYPTLEEAKKAAMPIMQSNDDEIESFDPNEVMAKAYMTKKTQEEESSSSASSSATPKADQQEGPLAFLGLQQKSQDEDSSQDSKSDEKSEEKSGEKESNETVEKESQKPGEHSKDESEKDEDIEEVMDVD